MVDWRVPLVIGIVAIIIGLIFYMTGTNIIGGGVVLGG